MLSYVDVGGKKFNVEIADSVEEREKGLMFRDSLCDDCGMFFIFESEGKHGFWMKNVLMPLDIIYINEEMVVVDVLNVEPCGDVCEVFYPKEEALYVLEVNKGNFDENLIGEKVELL